MFDSADILVNREPLLGDVFVEGDIGVVRVTKASEVPRGFEEGIEGIGFSESGFFASGARDMFP